MTSGLLRRARGDDGVSLVLALVFIVIVGLFATVALTKSQNTLSNGQQLELRGDAAYTADGAVDQALSALREDVEGTEPSKCAQTDDPTETGSYALNGTTSTWTCTLLGGRAKKSTDVTTADYAIIVTSAATAAFQTQSGSGDIIVNGSVYLNGPQTNSLLKTNVQVKEGDLVSPVSANCETQLAALTNITVTSGFIKACTEGSVTTAQPTVALPSAPSAIAAVTAPPLQTTLPGKPKPCKVFYPGQYTTAPNFKNLVNANQTVDAVYFVSGLYYFNGIGTWTLDASGLTVIGGERVVTEDTVALTGNDCDGMTDDTAMALYAPLLGANLTKTANPMIYFDYGVTWVLGNKSTLEPKNVTMTLFTPPVLAGSSSPFSLVAFKDDTNGYKKISTTGGGTPVALSGFSNNTKAHLNAKIMTPSAKLDMFSTNDTEAVARAGVVAYELLLQVSSGGSGSGLSIKAPYNKKNPPPPFRTVKVEAVDATGVTSTKVVAVVTISNFPPYSVTTESWRTD